MLHDLDPPTLVMNCHTFLDPSLEPDILYGQLLILLVCTNKCGNIFLIHPHYFRIYFRFFSMTAYMYSMNVLYNENQSNFNFGGKHYLHQSRFHLCYYVFINTASLENMFFISPAFPVAIK